MSESELCRRQRDSLHEVIRLASERDRSEVETKTAKQAKEAAATQEYQRIKAEIQQRYKSRTEQARVDDELKRRQLEEEAVAGETAAKAEFTKANRRIATEFEQHRDQAKNDYQQAAWEINTVHETGDKAAGQRHAEDKRRLHEATGALEILDERLQLLQTDYRKLGLGQRELTPSPEDQAKWPDPIAELFDRTQTIDEQVIYAQGLVIPKLLRGATEVVLYVLPMLALAYPLGQNLGWTTGLIAAVVAGGVLGYLLRTWLAKVAHKQIFRTVPPAAQALTDAQALADYSKNWVEGTLKTRKKELAEKRDSEINRVRKQQAHAIGYAESQRDEQVRTATERYNGKSREIKTTRQRKLDAAIDENRKLVEEIETQYQGDSQTLENRYKKTQDAIRDKFDAAWSLLETRWRDGINGADEQFRSVASVVEATCPDWKGSKPLDGLRLPVAVPEALRFGQVELGLEQIPHGIPRDASLQKGLPDRFNLPAILAFPDRGNLLLETTGAEGRTAALELLRSMMIRLLTSLPPAKVRFTIIDPVGLGRNFAAFMHLADFDPALVNHRIWTEPEQIEDRLTDLSEHIEKVLQNYLRNEYETIEQYNATAGEVAEPFRVLVVADFPTHFDDRATRRLVNILSSGVRCGVLALVAVDRDKELPDAFRMEEVRPHATNLMWNRSRLVWQDADLGPYPLKLDALPAPEVTNKLLNQVGQAAKEASRVEVPFEFIKPPEAAYWNGNTRGGVEIPLGKAGATKMQMLDLGKGTSQHALVAGRTGSGKSTLFHTLITNLALSFSPDEVELYLIDFKKGVEFKTYATHALPHAQVVAIESEREFGISVLQRLDGVLRERAERFREAGVQDLPGYRGSPGAKPLPRVMLIVDEFQEFFIEDDKLAQEASLLLDRLVRQGRAFGVHVVLGSQTLGGAFSLARSTLGQMAVRIALQCSESDAHLILSEDNSAASLLSRPGEAVYNDANGAPDANAFFQVCWLDEAKRDGYLTRINEMTRQRMPGWTRKPIVFEGNVPGQVETNSTITAGLTADQWPASPRSSSAWLGDAVAIKDPTAATFRRQGGSHLLIVGQNDEAALGIMAASLLSFAAQFPPVSDDATREGARFYVLDGTPEDSSLAGRLCKLASALPHTAEIGAWRDSARVINAVAGEVQKRQEPGAPEGPELFLLIHDISRFRELRKREDDYGFGRNDEPATPADQLGMILREGPLVGVHVLVWCDGLNNLNRTFDRQALRELEQRVLFQMSPNDSSHLIDSPFASRLGPFRALFSNEDEGILEKFRPYTMPGDDWWNQARQGLARKTSTSGGNGSPGNPSTPKAAEAEADESAPR